MDTKKELQEFEDRVVKGMEEAYRKMVVFKKQMNSPLIVSRKGKVVAIEPDKIPPTTVYER